MLVLDSPLSKNKLELVTLTVREGGGVESGLNAAVMLTKYEIGIAAYYTYLCIHSLAMCPYNLPSFSI